MRLHKSLISGGYIAPPAYEEVVAAGTITAGQLVIVSGTAGTYTQVANSNGGDNDVVTGIARSSAVSGETFLLERIQPGAVYLSQYQGTKPASGDADYIGKQFGIESGELDYDNNTDKTLQAIGAPDAVETGYVECVVKTACIVPQGGVTEM